MKEEEMEERELLELAAKAAGMEHMRWSGPMGLSRMLDPSRPETTGSIGPYWNPLTDDSDALRLAVKLGLQIRQVHFSAHAGMPDRFWQSQKHDSDPYAATRRAIVRAAAALAKQGA
jgi:hypothetical protein